MKGTGLESGILLKEKKKLLNYIKFSYDELESLLRKELNQNMLNIIITKLISFYGFS